MGVPHTTAALCMYHGSHPADSATEASAGVPVEWISLRGSLILYVVHSCSSAPPAHQRERANW